MKDLTTLSESELKDFFDSFDLVLSDVDGVLWLFLEIIPGTADGIKAFKKMGKKVVFVSNNTTKTIEVYHKQLQAAGFELEKDEIITPVLAMISFLQKSNFNKNIFVIGMSSIRKELESAGFKLIENAPDIINESLREFADHSITPDDSIGAVIADADINVNYLKLQKAATYLKNHKTIFITGATDCKLPIGLNLILIGPGYFHKILEGITERKGYALAKPSPHLNEFLAERLKIVKPSRVLFIGDSIPEDMGFANNGGYKKLLVLSGLSKRKDIEQWSYPDELKPDFYVDSLKTIHDLVQKHFNK